MNANLKKYSNTVATAEGLVSGAVSFGSMTLLSNHSLGRKALETKTCLSGLSPPRRQRRREVHCHRTGRSAFYNRASERAGGYGAVRAHTAWDLGESSII